ncbi:biotin/methionine sulfoxide reductase [Pacificibacter maritimus]|uniref:Biotin/methionine sulfoxide reductase n=1 Tax=Pacificibacter maritimus TaxID=762213 RepID=A0A3N4UK17_9RHOB|nr:molybdopterin-dependent oxidoreductase [Pacificibacter maritimus]RPE70932.1 biotin/methionine sulfoxide reductase [Pacificibacter maritimus]
MELFASHFGAYEVDRTTGTPTLRPFRHDPCPSPLGQDFLSLADDPERILSPMARRGWLEGDAGAKRGQDDFVPIDMDQATQLAAHELDRVRKAYGNRAIFGGSYGWGSAGRFHHPQSQLKRFLNMAGGFVSARNTYSYGTAKVLIPHLVGDQYADPGGLNPTWDRIIDAQPFILSFGGMRLSNAQVEAGGTGAHRMPAYLESFIKNGGEMLTLSPDARDAPAGEHLAINAGADAAAMLAMAHVLLVENAIDHSAVHKISTGLDAFCDLLRGVDDGFEKSPEWAAPITGIDAKTLRDIARRLSHGPALINLAWSLQRAVKGEQPYWAALALATISGQIGRSGCGIAYGLGAVSSVGVPLRRLKGPAFEQGPNPVSDYIPVARITQMLEQPGQQIAYNGDKLTLPDIRLIWWAGGNPFHHHQDLNRLAKAWRRPETVIVHDSVWTATARHADLVFPSATSFERQDIAAGSRDDWLFLSTQVMEPPQGVETDHSVLSRISKHLGFADKFHEGLSADDWIARLYKGYQTAFPELPNWEQFCQDGFAHLAPPAPEDVEQPLEKFVAAPQTWPLSTPSGKIELMPKLMQKTGLLSSFEPDSTRASLRLLSPQPAQRLHSQLNMSPTAQAARKHGCEIARAHPKELERAGVKSGEICLLSNQNGTVQIVIEADINVMEGHVTLVTGGWYNPVKREAHQVDLGGNPNTLTADLGSSALSQGASAGGAWVDLRPSTW